MLSKEQEKASAISCRAATNRMGKVATARKANAKRNTANALTLEYLALLPADAKAVPTDPAKTIEILRKSRATVRGITTPKVYYRV
jgi:hypothetical protein